MKRIHQILNNQLQFGNIIFCLTSQKPQSCIHLQGRPATQQDEIAITLSRALLVSFTTTHHVAVFIEMQPR